MKKTTQLSFVFQEYANFYFVSFP